MLRIPASIRGCGYTGIIGDGWYPPWLGPGCNGIAHEGNPNQEESHHANCKNIQAVDIPEKMAARQTRRNTQKNNVVYATGLKQKGKKVAMDSGSREY
jgi:hypothetical protein